VRSPRWSWLVFTGCAAAVTVAMGWVTTVTLQLERAELYSSAAARHQEKLQSALWRMDSWLSVFLGREAARPYFDYLPYVEGEPARVSPLLTLQSDYIPLHFQLDANGVTSPQVLSAPPGLMGLPVTLSELAQKQQELDRSLEYIDLERVRAGVALAESLPTTKLADLSMPSDSRPADERTEYDARVSCTVPPAPGSAWADGIRVDVGTMIPLWLPHLHDQERYELIFVRRVGIGTDKLYQGFVVNWPALRDSLLDEARDLLAETELVRVLPHSSGVDPAGRYLANLPVALIAPAPAPPASVGLTPARTTLGLAWLLAIVAALAVGITLHKSVELSERRRRFVSAVTHELRTPLTTFKMYSEMLADGVIPEGERRQQYLETLKDESERLSMMVANVLTHARLEEGRGTSRVEKLTIDGLLAHVTPPLHRQAEASGFTLDVKCESPGAEAVEADAESILQVLRNLVDNAGKYGRNGAESRVNLHVHLRNGVLSMRVRDYGPGVPATRAKSIFNQFDRGDRDAADPNPGTGLGLTIARRLARDMGGDVSLESPPDGGACFRLDVPRA